MIGSRILRLKKLVQLGAIRCQTTATTSQVQEMENTGAIMEDFTLDGAAIPFARAKIGTFFQDVPKLGNTFNEDVLVRGYLKRILPENVSNKQYLSL